ncbi:probable RNA helicase SDE3 [Rhododendron vialii]|uniref:probable RNA helicase SDE3 n=1 Tax=Rhododendron vialii TaxID=182163 RepID=UPI00265F91BD|nr:probable RNA helicase SDE3 [Rhododendron vialii]
MSWFLATLRRIIGLDDNQEEGTRLRNGNRGNNPYYDTPSRGYVPPTTTTTSRGYVPPTTTTTTTTNARTYGRIQEPSGAYRTAPSGAYTTTQIPTQSYSNSWNSTPSVSTPPPPPVSSLSSSSFGTPLSSPKPHRPSTKPFLSLAPSNSTNPNSKTAYILVEKDASPIYAIPEDFKDSIKNDVVPGILKRPLSPSTYKGYFEALLYAEDFYLEKWDGFEMKNVTLELEEASIYKRKGKYNKKNLDDEKDDKVFVTFELDSIPERRPFLLSRDFVSVSPSGTGAEPLQGLIYRVVKSSRVLVDFGKDFHVQHHSACKYNVSFSFNRVCLKRAHQAVATASDPLFRNFLFPDSISKNSLLTAQLPSIDSNLDSHQISAVRHILSNQNAVPYLVEGPIAVDRSNFLSRTGFVVCEAVLQVYRTSPSCRILICAPTNKGCDVLTRRLRGKIPESNIFRANAAFRELDGVPEDILPSCLYKKERECFYCPSIHELGKYKVISSTFMSSFRLHNEGITAGHFSHIFLVDASSVIEPEAMVALANLANESTVVTVTGAPGNHSGWIRSHIARQNGLLISYFERLRQSKLYDSLDPKVITVL